MPGSVDGRRARPERPCCRFVRCVTVAAMAIDDVQLPSRPTTLDEPVAHWAKEKPDEVAVMYGERTWTWAEWDDRVRRCAGGLRRLGVGKGDVVAFLDK